MLVWVCLLLVSNHPPKPCRHPVSPAAGADWRIVALMWIRETPVIHPSTQHPSTQVRKEQREAFTNRKVFIVQIKSSTCANHLTVLSHFFYFTSFSLQNYFVILVLKKYGGITRTSSTTTNLQKWLFLQEKLKNNSTLCFYQLWKVSTFHKYLKSQITLNLFFWNLELLLK